MNKEPDAKVVERDTQLVAWPAGTGTFGDQGRATNSQTTRLLRKSPCRPGIPGHFSNNSSMCSSQPLKEYRKLGWEGDEIQKPQAEKRFGWRNLMGKHKVIAEQLHVTSRVHERNNVPEKRNCGQPVLARSEL